MPLRGPIGRSDVHRREPLERDRIAAGAPPVHEERFPEAAQPQVVGDGLLRLAAEPSEPGVHRLVVGVRVVAIRVGVREPREGVPGRLVDEVAQVAVDQGTLPTPRSRAIPRASATASTAKSMSTNRARGDAAAMGTRLPPFLHAVSSARAVDGSGASRPISRAIVAMRAGVLVRQGRLS